uniref:ABC transporter permease n=1 Tax=Prevotella sp. GTC17253 TaxID=3236793 RepID=A0AB33ILF2_9BACT
MNSKQNNFSWPRFRAYFVKLWTEQWRINLLRWGILFGVGTVLMLWGGLTTYPAANKYFATHPEITGRYDDFIETVMVCAVLLAFVVMAFWSSQVIADAVSKGKRIAMLTTPVTPFENWLVRWLLAVPIPITIYTLLFQVADLIRVGLCAPLFPHVPIRPVFLWATPYLFGSNDFGWTFQLVLLCSSLFLVGGMFFPKRPVLKTSITLFILFWVFFIAGGSMSSWFDTDEAVLMIVYRVFLGLSIPFLWWLSYVRFKELEVI